MMKKRPSLWAALAAALLLVVILGPFAHVVFLSFVGEGPSFSLQGYYSVFLGSSAYLSSFWRTLFLCAVMVAGQVVLSIFAGLGFAKFFFPGKNLWFFLLLVVMVLPLQVTLVPNFRILGGLGLLNTQGSLVLPAVFAPLGTFLMTQCFRSIPDEIIEAAQLDGATLVGVLWRVLVPMSKNGVASVVLLSFLEAWNMVEQPIAYLKDPVQYPLSVSLAYVGAQDAAAQLACVLLTLLPPVLLFLRFHQELVQGIALAEVKG